ncbi:uncharacterized protein LOC143633330 [Bidens hawaiensis]|uniref:uncharacterized protein LOC143633330 n=1 Tax=Bidens hawaiensis TaxID=980011 RepID=UPI004049952E
MGGKIDHSINKGNVPYTFRLSGENYHCLGSLLPLQGCKPQFCQLYIYDTENEVSNRQEMYFFVGSDNNSMDDELEMHIINYLKTMLDSNNYLVQAYRMVRNCFEENPQLNLKLRIIGTRQHDARQYNLPSSSEIAALIVGDIGDAVDNRDIIVTKQSGSLKRISELHPSYTPLQYPLFHPFGEDGYQVNILHKNVSSSSTVARKKVTIREFFAYHILDRPNTFSTMLNGRRLFKQILVDKYTMIEAQRLHFIRGKQHELRCDTYQSLRVIYTIEFQKRGLPHAHICIFMHPCSKILNPQDIDKFISAEIPNKDSVLDLYKLVSDYMIHGPCGDANPKCTCMVNKKCSKNFPKMFNDVTAVDSQGFPVYKRRDNGQYVVKSDIMMDNRTVVPYNKTLLKQFQAYINVEWCNQDGSIKYVSACEATWRIFSFDVHYRIPSVMRLAFHLPGEQHVIYGSNEDIEDILNKTTNASSMFTGCFECNKNHDLAKNLTYAEFPTKYGDNFKSNNPLMVEELSYDTETMNNKFKNLFDSLTDEQRGVYNEIMSVLIDKKGGVCFVYGYDDTGKTYLWITLSASIRSKGEVVLNVASSGIASLLLEGGRTAHSKFLIPINLTKDSICPVKGNTNVYELLKKTSLIIWDETPMIHKHAFEALDRTLNDVMNGDSGNTSEELFGAIFPGEEVEYLSSDSLAECEDVSKDFDPQLYSPDLLNGLKISRMPNHRLVLKVGVPIMQLRNINHEKGLCNGTRLQVISLSRRVIEAKVVSGTNIGYRTLVSRVSLTPTDKKLLFRLKRRQFSILVCFAMTINKSQGQSLSRVGLYLKDPVFSHGQLYVALSTVKSRDGKLVILDKESKLTNKTTNVVYKDIFGNVE